VTLNINQFHEHLDQLQEMTGLEYGPQSISTRSGLVLPAMHEFDYNDSGIADKENPRFSAYSRIPDERGVNHEYYVRMHPSDPSVPLKFQGSTPFHSSPDKNPKRRFYLNDPTPWEQTSANDSKVNNPEEVIERFKSEPVETSERLAAKSKEELKYVQDQRKSWGLSPDETDVTDWSSDGNHLERYAYDFRNRSTRPIRRVF
jgi:hypothetical protein